LKQDKPHWGARKLRELLVRRLNGDVRVPARSTIHAVLDRHGLVKRLGKARNRATGTPLSEGAAPNELWGTVRNCVREAMLMERRIITWLSRKRFWTSF
jgi:hypothetical protein